jgi:pSer/pThr/pTyr-binding forkhead associated (FHA) protein
MAQQNPQAAFDESTAENPDGFFPMRLVFRPGGQEVELSRPDMLLGRHSDADVRLPTPDISRRHCRFVFSNGEWEVYDLNSLNGLYVNGERVRQTTLQHQDLVAVGSFRLEVDLGVGDHADATTAREQSERVLQSIIQALQTLRTASQPL